MFGFLALLITTAGIVALYVMRIGVLDRYSIPQHVALLLSIVLAILQWKRGGSRLARTSAVLAVVGAVFFSGSLEYFTRYAKDRPLGPPIGASLADLVLVDVRGERIALLDERAPPLTLLLCFRGFW